MIQLKTKLPGPKSQALMEERKKHVVRAYHTTPLFIARAQGAVLEDVDGNHLLDFGAGFGVMNVGHLQPQVVKRVKEQADKFFHISFNVTPYESYVALAKKLNEITPGSFPKKTFLANSGAEAVENAIKIARMATGRRGIIVFDHAFHGRTYMAMTLTAKSKPYKYGFDPFCPEVYRAPFPYRYRWPTATSDAEMVEQCFAQFVDVVNSQISADKVAAVIIEPVAGEGGFLPVPKEFMQKLRKFTSDNGILLIADEIQSGFGRTGSFFTSEQLGVEPDLITMAKGMGAGMPISAVTGRAEIMDKIPEGAIGGTYCGNPLACEAALGAIEIFQKTDLFDKAKKLGRALEDRLAQWKEKFQVVGDVRGMGPMRAVEFVKDRKTKEPHKDFTGKLVQYCYERGVVILSAGTYGNVVRFLIPLGIEPNQLNQGLDIIEKGVIELGEIFV